MLDHPLEQHTLRGQDFVVNVSGQFVERARVGQGRLCRGEARELVFAAAGAVHEILAGQRMVLNAPMQGAVGHHPVPEKAAVFQQGKVDDHIQGDAFVQGLFGAGAQGHVRGGGDAQRVIDKTDIDFPQHEVRPGATDNNDKNAADQQASEAQCLPCPHGSGRLRGRHLAHTGIVKTIHARLARQYLIAVPGGVRPGQHQGHSGGVPVARQEVAYLMLIFHG